MVYCLIRPPYTNKYVYISKLCVGLWKDSWYRIHYCLSYKWQVQNIRYIVHSRFSVSARIWIRWYHWNMEHSNEKMNLIGMFIKMYPKWYKCDDQLLCCFICAFAVSLLILPEYSNNTYINDKVHHPLLLLLVTWPKAFGLEPPSWISLWVRCRSMPCLSIAMCALAPSSAT